MTLTLNEIEGVDAQFSDHPKSSGRTPASEQDNAWPYAERHPQWWAKMFFFEWIRDRPKEKYPLPSVEVIEAWFTAAMDRGRDNLLLELTPRQGNTYSRIHAGLMPEENLNFIIEVADQEKRRTAFDWATTEFGCCFVRENNEVVKNPRWDYIVADFFAFRDQADAALFRVFWG